MNQPLYTDIPDTSDLNYWEVKIQDNQLRSTTFVPRDKELHLQLKKGVANTFGVYPPREGYNYLIVKQLHRSNSLYLGANSPF